MKSLKDCDIVIARKTEGLTWQSIQRLPDRFSRRSTPQNDNSE